MHAKSWVSKVLIFTSVLLLLAIPGFSRDKYETIDATAWGTSTQLGRNIGVTLIIYEWSTAEDRQILVDAFKQGSNKGLVNALRKDEGGRPHEHHGNTRHDVSFIRLIQTPTGRKIRFVTNRQIRFGEAYSDSPTQWPST